MSLEEFHKLGENQTTHISKPCIYLRRVLVTDFN